MEAASWKYDQLLTPLLAPLRSLEIGGEVESSKPLHGLAFLVTGPIQKPTKSPLIKAKDVPVI